TEFSASCKGFCQRTLTKRREAPIPYAQAIAWAWPLADRRSATVERLSSQAVNIMSQFTIRQVDRSRSQSVEQLGSKPKFWFDEGIRRLLFKADDRGTGEDWAEVIACHLCALIGLPHVEYELAAEFDGSTYVRPGVVCENMAKSPVVLVLGNELL